MCKMKLFQLLKFSWILTSVAYKQLLIEKTACSLHFLDKASLKKTQGQYAPVQLKSILCELRLICVTGNALINLMQVWTDLCRKKCSYITGINFVQVWTNLCDRKCSYVAEINFMLVWTDLRGRKCSFPAGGKYNCRFQLCRSFPLICQPYICWWKIAGLGLLVTNCQTLKFPEVLLPLTAICW